MDYLNLLKTQFNNRIGFQEKRPGIMQLISPLYHEDGDMLDIFIQPLNSQNNHFRISDFGMTLMRLSYDFDIDTANKEKIFNRILTENQISEDNGNLFMDVEGDSLYPSIMHFSQVVNKISSMKLYKREVIQSLFYEILDEIVQEKLQQFKPFPKRLPIPARDDLEVDYSFDIKPYPVYLFGVKDSAKARLATICFLEFQRAQLKFKGFVVHEDFDNLSKKDRNRITSATDKQFTSLDDFKDNASQVFEREVA